MKTNELTGTALDWAVAKCEGGEGLWYDTVSTYWVKIKGYDLALKPGWAQSFTPSTDWAQGGPIIEREKIQIGIGSNSGSWCANQLGSGHAWVTASTPLIAAMRCYVESKLGDEIEIPSELL